MGNCDELLSSLAAGEIEVPERVTLTIDGRDVAMLPFVQDVLRSVSLAVVAELKDTGLAPDSDVVIHIKGT